MNSARKTYPGQALKTLSTMDLARHETRLYERVNFVSYKEWRVKATTDPIFLDYKQKSYEKLVK